MGFELNRLMRERGVATPGAVAYSGATMPVAPAAPGAGAAQADIDKYNADLAAYNASLPALAAKYEADMDAYNKYRQEYERRVSGTPQYLQSQFDTSTGATSPPVMTFSPAQMAALRPGGIGMDRMNRNIQTYAAENPNATRQQILAQQEKYGISDLDIRNAMGMGFQFGNGPSGFGSLGARTAAAPGGIGMDQYNANIRKWFADNPNATPEQVAAAKAQYGVTDRDIYGATNSYFGNVLRAPTYAAAVDPNARSSIPATPDRRTALDTTTTTTKPTTAAATTTTTTTAALSPVDRLRGTFDQSIFGKTPDEKAAYYNSLLNAGYDDATIRAAINAPLDANWSLLQTLARQQREGTTNTTTTADTTTADTTTADTTTDTSVTPTVNPVDTLRSTFDQSIFGKSPNEKATYYNSLLKSGYDDATIRAAINAPLDANWTALQNLARQQNAPATSSTPGTTLPDFSTPAIPDFNVGGNPRVGTFDSVQLMSHGGGVHKMAQKYNVGGAVRRFRLGGLDGEEDEQRGAVSYPVAPQREMQMRPLDKYDDLPDSVGNTPIGVPPAAPVTRSVAAPAPAPAPAPVTPPVTESPAARPITPRPSPSTPMSPAANDLAAMLQRYTGAESPYAADLAAARTKVDTESKAFENLLKTAMKPGSTAPDKTELYFRLAAAFGAPTRTGSFGETLSGVGKELGEFAKETRASKKAEQQLGLQLGLEAQKMRMQGAREELGALRALAGEEMKDRRAVLLEYLKSGRPQSEAGKAAVDAGLTQGTPEFANFVNKYIEEKISSGNAIKEAMVLIAQGNLAVSQAGLGVRQSAEERAKEAAKKLTPAEVKLKADTEDKLLTIDSAMTDLGRAFDLNKTSFDTTLKDAATRKLMEETGSKDPRVVNTRELENLLKSAMISSASQKLTGVLSDSDIRLLQSIAGLDAKSKTEREQILKNAYRSLRNARVAQRKRLDDITAGLYRETNPTPAGLEEN